MRLNMFVGLISSFSMCRGGFLLAINHIKLLRDAKNQFEYRLRATFKA